MLFCGCVLQPLRVGLGAERRKGLKREEPHKQCSLKHPCESVDLFEHPICAGTRLQMCVG
jgi:hypothetical protein